MTDQNNIDARKKVWALIKDIRIAQLVTVGKDDGLRSRPMATSNREFDGTLWFLTSLTSGKTEEISSEGNVLLVYSEPAKSEYVSLTGKAAIVQDKDKIAECWSEPARIWFPKGKDDPNLGLIRVDVDRAEYWDNPGGKAVLIYGYALAALTGKTPEIGDHKKTEMR